MKKEILVVVLAWTLVGLATSTPNRKAETCTANNCKLPDCRCISKEIPGDLPVEDTPQFIFISYDNSVTEHNYREYYEKAFIGRKNPDGCPISATHFVYHDYTDYSFVHHLHAHGQEIALHSEDGDERKLISHFADIPIEDIQGGRGPGCWSGGECLKFLKAFKKNGLTYDSSLATRNNFWPYTFDDIDLSGLWEIPRAMLKDDSNNVCSMIDACTDIPDDAEGIFNFMKRNFEAFYIKKAPLHLFMHAAWFGQRENAFEGFIKFLDYIGQKKDVYVVSMSRALEWVRHPTKLSELKNLWPECQKTYTPTCSTEKELCKIEIDGETRFVRVCTDCPPNYPGGNPSGEC